MKISNIFIMLNTFLSIISTSRPALAGQPVTNTFTLNNGIRIVSIYIAESNNVSIFSFFPMGLASDGPGQTQWSHLIEHLVIQTPKPLGFNHANAETLPDNMRLDFYGTVKNWQEGLSHHLNWIKGVPFTEGTLQTEKARIIAECDFVAEKLQTHKFAIAAWAQAYRHGKKYVPIKGDINKVTLTEIQKYRDTNLLIPNKLLICVVGGINFQTLKPVITEKFSSIKSNTRIPDTVKLHHGEHKITWDLNALHLVLTWPIPDVNEQDYPALMVASQLLNMKLFADSQLKNLTGMVFAGSDLTTPEGNFFYISASLKPDSSFDEFIKNINQHLQSFQSASANPLEVAMIGQQLSYQLTNIMDPAIVKAQAPPNMTQAMIEGNIGLQWAMHEYHYGRHRALLAQRLSKITASQLYQVARNYLTVDKCSVCTIAPQKQ